MTIARDSKAPGAKQEPASSEADVQRLRSQLIHDFEEFERDFRRNYPIVWWTTLVGPFAVTFGILGFLWIRFGWAFMTKLVTTSLAAFFFFGRFIILGGENPEAAEITRFFTTAQLFALITYLDLLVAVLLSFHIGFLFRIPILGPRAEELVADGRFILTQHPWMRRMTFLGLIAFVMFPLAATGSVGGSIFGRLLGMSRWQTLAGILLGSIAGNGVMLLGSDIINRLLDKDNALIRYGGILLIVIIIVLLERRYRKMKQLARASLEKQAAASNQS